LALGSRTDMSSPRRKVVLSFPSMASGVTGRSAHWVRRGYAPAHRRWYLRIWFDDELDPENRPTRGTFDLTGPKGPVAEIDLVLPGLLRHEAGEFFDKQYAGG
jgi:hypothetical protein